MRLIIPIGRDPDVIRNFYNQSIYEKEYGNGIILLDFEFIKKKHPYWETSKVYKDFNKKLISLIKQDIQTYILMPNLDNDEVELFIDMLEHYTLNNCKKSCLLIDLKDSSNFDFESTEHYCNIHNISFEKF